ncbi:hypothetical protein GUJ93_ZPchr0069g33272 [Zizania palustris]|uniref:Rhodanese domain-containing protein n=1 Tax=Zizania palustris TaxID=103762 RepID=A0A8J5V361_ZIZPA|nr:hypothetical protein GUJ93_ZPchr0069g33272 [Zizania palustris]
MLLPVCSAAPSCSPLCPVTASVAHVGAPALRRVEVGALSSVVEPPLTVVSDLAGTTAAVDATVNDAAERALLDAPEPTTFPADASEAEATIARLSTPSARKSSRRRTRSPRGYDKLRLSAYEALGAWRKSANGAIGGLTASVDATKKQATGGVTDASGALQEKVAGAGAVAVDVLRKGIVLPRIHWAGQLLLLGGSTTIGLSYWLFAYGGYSGDLSPESTLELLRNDDKAVLVDVRPEDLRVKEGIPDLRRGARSKYASVASPEIEGSVKKLLKGGRDIDDVLLAVVIRNLKLVKGDSKVIIMDANGTQSKAIARLLKKLGIQRPYLVKGVSNLGQRTFVLKELKPETALIVLNEDAEEILEGIKPTPTLVLGSLLGFSAAAYALLGKQTRTALLCVKYYTSCGFEYNLLDCRMGDDFAVHWCSSLGLTIYLRFSTYEGSEDLQQDLKLLLSPVRVGAEAFSWAAKKLEPNKIGLATSPSTKAVQDRVLQAAAKHESQPPDAETADGLVSEA